jgi:hypothetical protein
MCLTLIRYYKGGGGGGGNFLMTVKQMCSFIIGSRSIIFPQAVATG